MKNTVVLSATAGSQASAAAAPARMPPRNALSTVFAAFALRSDFLGAEASALIPPRYRPAMVRNERLWLTLRGHCHALLLALEARRGTLRRLLDVHRVGRVDLALRQTEQ